jgi:hypothetical protein
VGCERCREAKGSLIEGLRRRDRASQHKLHM